MNATFGLVTSVNTSISNAVPYHTFHDRIRPEKRPDPQTQTKRRVQRSKGHTILYFGMFI